MVGPWLPLLPPWLAVPWLLACVPPEASPTAPGRLPHELDLAEDGTTSAGRRTRGAIGGLSELSPGGAELAFGGRAGGGGRVPHSPGDAMGVEFGGPAGQLAGVCHLTVTEHVALLVSGLWGTHHPAVGIATFFC